VDEDPAGGDHLLHERAYLRNTELQAHFYPQDIPTSITKTQLVPGGKEALVWTGLQGTIGVLVPFVSREDVDFFHTVEGSLRNEEPPLAGREHLVYRSYYVPVKGVIDGDGGEGGEGRRERVAGKVDKGVREVERKIADIRSRVAY